MYFSLVCFAGTAARSGRLLDDDTQDRIRPAFSDSGEYR